jgi:hypothetical protein
MKLRKWTPQEVELLRTEYPDANTVELCKKLGRSYDSVTQKVHVLGICKSPDFLQDKIKTMLLTGKNFQFKKGLHVWNKGRKLGSNWGKETHFKKGSKPHNYKPVGSKRITRDGYHETKVADPKTWKQDHVMLWEQANGPVPKHCIIRFIDGNKNNITLSNLMLINTAQNMTLNTIHRFPAPLKLAIKTLAKLKRTIHAKEQD